MIRADKVPVFGNPDIDLVSTSYVERSNLTLRMGNRRFTRLTNAFSKKLENHTHMLAVSFMHYNFCRKHSTIKTTPAVAAGAADHQWTLEEVVEMIDAHLEAKLENQYEKAFAVLNFTAPPDTPEKLRSPGPENAVVFGPQNLRKTLAIMNFHNRTDPLPIAMPNSAETVATLRIAKRNARLFSDRERFWLL